MKILLVDDDPVMLMFTGHLIAKDGRFAVMQAADGAEALEVARREHPDAILTDFKMPVMDGLELLRSLRADPATAGIPVIFCSGQDDAAMAAVFLEAGACGTLCKPYNPLTLVADILARLGLEGRS